MNRWAAKLLDWTVIQIATRSLRAHSTLETPVLNNGVVNNLTLKFPWHGGRATPTDFTFSSTTQFQFTSSVKSQAVESNTAHGRFYSAHSDGVGFPTIVLLHGWNAEAAYEKSFPYIARRLNRLQINCAMIELPYHGHRRPKHGPVRDFISTDLLSMHQAAAQALADIYQLTGWLIQNGSSQVGLWGFSLGGWLAGWVAQTDPRIKLAVLTTPIVQIDRAIAELPFCRPARESLRNTNLKLKSLNLGLQQLAIPNSQLLLIESLHDLFVPSQTIEDLWTAWARPEIWRLSHGHISAILSKRTASQTAAWILQHCREN